MSRTSLGLFLAVALLVSACGEPSGDIAGDAPTTTPPPPPTTSTSETPTTSTIDADNDQLDVIVPPDRDGQLPPDMVVSCPTGPSFPVSALEDIPPLAEEDPGGVAEAIAPFLQGEEGRFWPQEGWRILHEGDEEILLVHSGPDGFWFIGVTESDGGWMWSGAQGGGSCPLQYRVPENLNTVEWRLDPGSPQPGPEATTLDVLLTERECVSGQEIGDRLVGPQIVMSNSEVRIAFAAERPPGDAFTCQGNPETPFTVELRQPLGERELIEGLATGLDLGDFLD